MEGSDLIATLIPIDQEKRAENAFRLLHNRNRYLPPTSCIADGPTISSRESTPAPQTEHNQDTLEVNDHYNSTDRIQLTFSNGPKNPSRGFVFGTNPESCDVLLGYRGAVGVSSRHFAITFNETGQVILKDSSSWGTTVSYDNQATNEVRRHFTWVLDLEREEGPWSIKVYIPERRSLAFKIHFPSRKTCQREYINNMRGFIQESHTTLPHLDNLGIYSTMTTAQPSQSLTPRQHPVYISERKLGTGSFGNVDMVVDVSTGFRYARKQFHKPVWNRDQDIRRRQRDDWLGTIDKEIRIMKDHPHDHIVQIFGFQERPSPFLVMPYFPLGNLQYQHHEHPISLKETVEFLRQALEALAYLHPRGVVHRDLKPENILVESRTPLITKLADFGLANDGSDLKTFCGTRIYAAPEIYANGNYTSAVDIWSLGVIILQYTYGLPEDTRVVRGRHRSQRSMLRGWASSWCNNIIEHANDWESEHLIDLLTNGMLCINPKERFSAAKCLEIGYDAELFNSRALDTGNTTPRPTTTEHSMVPYPSGNDTIIMDALWAIEDPKKHDYDIKRQHTSPERISQYDDFKASEYRVDDVQTTIDIGSYKRRRSPISCATTQLLDSDRVKRLHGEPCDDSPTPRLYALSGHDTKTSQSNSTYKTTLSFLMDLQCKEGENRDIDDNTYAAVRRFCDYLTELNITELRIFHYENSQDLTVKAVFGLDEITLTHLTSQERTNSTKDLAVNLMDMLHLEASQLQITYTPDHIQSSQASERGSNSFTFYNEHELIEVKELVKRDAQLVTEHVKQGCCFQTDDYLQLPFRAKSVMVRKSDCRLNATQILGAAGVPRNILKTFSGRGLSAEVVKGNFKCQGTYVEFGTGLQLCDDHSLDDFKAILLKFLVVYKQHLKDLDLPTDRLPKIDPPHPASSHPASSRPASEHFSLKVSKSTLVHGTPVDRRWAPPEDLDAARSRSILTEPSYSQGSYPPLAKDSSYLQPLQPNLDTHPLLSSGYGYEGYSLESYT